MRSWAGKRDGAEQRARRIGRLIAARAPEAILGVDESDRVVFANAAAERLFGYAHGELLQAPLAALMAPGSREGLAYAPGPLWPAAARVPGAPGEPPIEAIASRKDGSRIPVEVAWSRLADPRAGVIVAVVRDASAHRKAIGELLSMAERFQILVQAVQDYAIYLLDPEGRVASWNVGAERIKGWRADEIVGRHFSVFYTPEDVARGHPQALLEAAAAGGRTADEGWRVRKDGTRFYADVVVTALQDAVGHLRGFATVTRDVTPRWRTELRRRFVDEVLLVLSSSISDYEGALHGLARASVRELADFCVLDVVDETGKLARFDVASATPQDTRPIDALRALPACLPVPAAFVTKAQVPQKAHLFNRGPRDNGGAEPEDESTRGMMNLVGAHSAIATALAPRGHALGVLTLMRTHTAEPYEEADRHLMESVCAKAGLHVDNVCLYRALLNAIAERDRALAFVAHDLRSPLNSIVLRTDLILRTLAPAAQADDAVRTSLSRIQDAAAQMDRMIRDLLDFEQIQHGTLKVDVHPWSPVDVVGLAVDQARMRADAQGVRLRVAVDPALPPVMADRDRVLQVFANLIDNALKFTPPGGDVEVSAHAEDPRVWFAVRDTGPGIPPEHLPRLFDRFWQLSRGDKRGAGLGLGICKSIVETHGGELRVESQPGQGSTFRFALPMAR